MEVGCDVFQVVLVVSFADIAERIATEPWFWDQLNKKIITISEA